MISVAGKTSNQDVRNVCIICYHLAKHLEARQSVAGVIASTGLVIDKESARIRMVFLNSIKAAPGQEHRLMVRHFLVHKGWIKTDQYPEDLPLEQIPNGKDETDKFMDELIKFGMSMQQEA